ncbi:MAG TPA: hypothetical protein VEX68_27285 [Bryobacteraceae bacterium]|nr:hypothetical protein [Bryobacteraceae bacterium]
MDRTTVKRGRSLGLATLMGLGCIVAVGLAQQTTTLERGEVLAVNGNDIVVKMDTGEVRHYTAPPGATANVDGKQIGVTGLRPGMKLQRTTITTTSDRVVQSLRTTEGTVWQVNAPYVIFTGPDGKNKQVKVPDGTKFTIQGEQKTVFDLRKGMKFTATIVTQAPETVVSSVRTTTGNSPPPPRPVIATVPAKIESTLLIEEAPARKPVQVAQSTAPPASTAPAPSTAAAQRAPEPAPTRLPKTASPFPMMGLLGLTLGLAGFGVRLSQKS